MSHNAFSLVESSCSFLDFDVDAYVSICLERGETKAKSSGTICSVEEITVKGEKNFHFLLRQRSNLQSENVVSL